VSRPIAGVGAGERRAQVLADLVERDLLTFSTISAICGWISGERAGRGRHGQRAVDERRARRALADEIEGDVELTGEQVAGAQLRPHALRDQLLQHDRVAAVGRRRRLQQRLANRAEPLRKDLGEHLDRETLARRVVLQGDRRHAADLDAEQIDPRPFARDRVPTNRRPSACAPAGRRAAPSPSCGR
jgi:hypothetical protein